MGASGTLQAVSPEYISFTFFILINSIGTAGVYPLAFILGKYIFNYIVSGYYFPTFLVLGVEMVGRKKREATGIIINYFYALGEAVLALIAWISGDWVWTQLIVSLPCVLFFVYYWYVSMNT